MILKHSDCLKALREVPDESVDSLITDPPAGISFMGKDWDSDKGGSKQWIKWMTEVMTECRRVLKPGAHALVWAIPRTSHWTATALEDAGFEIRDVITHLFGSGFPKSMNISIAIDKQSGAMGHRGKAFVTAGAGERKDIQDTSGWETDPGHKAITPEAKQWQGWGTALKPASEHWILVRKPLGEKTVAANTLKYGTGGINIDASRIEGKPRTTHSNGNFQSKTKNTEVFGEFGLGYQCPEPQGRFPANLVLSHNDDCEEKCSEGCAVAMLDEQPHQYGMKLHAPGNKNPTKIGKGNNVQFSGELENVDASRFQLGGDPQKVSRFFYCAKASKKDKGLNNTHPTVKSTSLMNYLIKLITPPGGIVLDPFMGSGSTGVAAIREGFRFIGIEQDESYFNISTQRIAHEEKLF